MELDVFRIVSPDRRIAQPRDKDLGSSFDFTDADAELKVGYWAVLSSGAVANPGGSEDVDVPNVLVFPILAGSARMDARQSLMVTVGPVSPYEFETTIYVTGTTYAEGDPLTVRNDADGRGVLDKAVSTELVVARVTKVPVAGVNGLQAIYLGPQGNVIA